MRNVLMVRYRRVSTEEQKEKGYSLPEQTRLCDEKIAQIQRELEDRGEVVNIQVVDFEDTMGGDILNRPVLDEVREFVRTKRPDYFVCLDPDRFSRSLAHSLLVKEEVEAVGTRLVFVQHNYEKTAEGQMFYQFRGAIAQYEKAKILERTQRGMRGKLRQGKLPYHINIYGYTFDKEKDTIVIHEEEARWIKQLFEWSAAGVGPLEIRRRLNDFGVPAKKGGPWYTSSIRQMLRNTTYVGEMRCNRYKWEGLSALMQLPKNRRDRPITSTVRPKDEWIIVPVSPIIDRTLFDRVQANFRTLKRKAKKGAGILSGMMTCGLCGGAVHYVAHKQHGHVLRCINRYPSSRETKTPVPQCSLPYVKASLIEERVWAEVSEWLLCPESILESVRRHTVHNDHGEKIARLETVASSLKASIQEKRQEQATIVRNQSKKLLDDITAEGLLSEAKTEIDRLTGQLNRVTTELDKLREQSGAVSQLEDRISSITSQLNLGTERTKRALAAALPEERQRILRTVVQEVKCLPGKDCRVAPFV